VAWASDEAQHKGREAARRPAQIGELLDEDMHEALAMAWQPSSAIDEFRP
jgi:hypothetical protein